MHQHRPMLPSELTINEESISRYKQWLDSKPPKKVALLVGKPGIGKETMLRVIHRVYNYKERHIDPLGDKESLQNALNDLQVVKTQKNLKGRKQIHIFTEIDQYTLSRILRIRTVSPVVVVLEEYPKKVSCEEAEIIKCYQDTHKVMKRIESICREKQMAVPSEIYTRIRTGERIGKILSDIHVYSCTRTVQGTVATETSRLTGIDALEKILHKRGQRRRTYEEIESICERTGMQYIHDILFENYQEKCLSLTDLSILSRTASYYDSFSNVPQMHTHKTISVYLHHQLLYNDIFIPIRLGGRQKEKVKTDLSMKESLDNSSVHFNPMYTKNTLLISGTPYKRWDTIPYLQLLLNGMILKISTQSNRSKIDKYTKESIRYLLSSISSSEIEPDTLSKLISIDSPSGVPETILLPRYIYKEGHSNYVTRDITIKEILSIGKG
ncbi:hypothetical protein NEOKW01_1875 [Nematocida sp. AWRm80]|nr:hypothetical protein NEOKW01_1875 [Nematocida sp. AWRm80]